MMKVKFMRCCHFFENSIKNVQWAEARVCTSLYSAIHRSNKYDDYSLMSTIQSNQRRRVEE